MSTSRRRPCPGCGGSGSPLAGYERVELERCEDCGLVFLGRTDSGGTQSLYESDEYAVEHDEYFDHAAAHRHIAKKRLSWVGRRKQAGELLEVGPGSGEFLAGSRAAGFEVTAVEPSPGLAQKIEADFDVPAMRGFVEDLDLPTGAFDVICMFHVFEHVEDPRRMLASLRSLIKDDGVLFIEVPNFASAISARRGADWGAVSLRDLHVVQYTPATLATLVAAAGFEILEVETVGILPYQPIAYWRPRTVFGHGYRALSARSLRSTHPTAFDNLRLVATPAAATAV